VHLHRFPNGNGDSKERITHRVVYEFKTRHGSSPTSPAGTEYPPYPEISTVRYTSLFCWVVISTRLVQEHASWVSTFLLWASFMASQRC
jgi:hypothetical protein